jgi:hypothetical protein
MRRQSEDHAVTEIVGTMLLLGIAVTLFTVVYFSLMTVTPMPPEPSATIAFSVEGDAISLRHLGGESLRPTTEVIMIIGDDVIQTTVGDPVAFLNWDRNGDSLWGMGEQMNYTYGDLTGKEITVTIVDPESNTIVMSGSLYGEKEKAADLETHVASLPSIHSVSPLTITAQGDYRLDAVSLWYRCSGKWEDSFNGGASLVDTYNNMTLHMGYATVNLSGEQIDLTDYVDRDDGDVDASPDRGTHSDFNREKSQDGINDVLTESYSTSDLKDYVDSDTSDVDGVSDKGTHGDFSAQQSGPDQSFDTISEEDTGGYTTEVLIDNESFEGSWPPAGWFENGYTEWNKENNEHYDGSYSADFDGKYYRPSGRFYTPALDCSDAESISISFYFKENVDRNDKFRVDFFDGWTWREFGQYGKTSEDSWKIWETTITDTTYLIDGFRISWYAYYVENGEHIYVDYVRVAKKVKQLNYEMDLEVQWTNVDFDETNEELAIFCDLGSNTHYLKASGGYMRIGNGWPDWGSSSGTISFWIKWDIIDDRPWGQDNDMEMRIDGYSRRLVLDWGPYSSLTSNTVFSTGSWYFIAVSWNETSNNLILYVGDEANPPEEDAKDTYWTVKVSDVGVTQNDFLASRGGVDPTHGSGDDLRYWNIDRSLLEIRQDYDRELSGNEPHLQSYFKLNNDFSDSGPASSTGVGMGSYSFQSDVCFDEPSTESLQVDIWNTSLSTWDNLPSDLSDGWKNASISKWLTSSTFTIRFKGTSETTDTIQDSWKIDVCLLHMSSIESYALDLEVQWEDIQYDLPNEELCIFADTLDTEQLKVDVWTGGSWVNVIQEVEPGWNNKSVKTWLTGPTFTIRYRDEQSTGDIAMSSWWIDAALLHLWRLGGERFYEGNLTSVAIHKPSGVEWDRFYASVNNTGGSTFNILDEDGAVLMSGLDGNGNDIHTILENNIRLYGSFDESVTLYQWNVTSITPGWTSWSNPENPDTNGDNGWKWNFPFSEGSGYYEFYSIGTYEGRVESPPPFADAYCLYQQE